MTNNIAVRFDNVHKQYGKTKALNGINFDLIQGEFFGLLGPNGAGKSTLINVMSGLSTASSGSIQVFGKDVIRHFRDTRKSIGLVPQELISDGFFDVRSMLNIQAGYFGLSANSNWIDELLETLSLTDKSNALISALSGGMKRRVLIAMALVHKPKIIVLDEPTAGVDVDLRKTLWQFIRKLHAMGTTIILTTHYLEEAEALCDRIAIINHGQLIALQNKHDLLAGNRLEKVYLDILKKEHNPLHN